VKALHYRWQLIQTAIKSVNVAQYNSQAIQTSSFR